MAGVTRAHNAPGSSAAPAPHGAHGAHEAKLRPDGLVIVTTGKKVWSALVEAKVGNKTLSAEQLEPYLDLAKKHGVDAVITISNQFAALPTHHPVAVSGAKLRKTGLYHFSWLSIVSKAMLLVDSKSVASTDAEQAFVLAELIRYLKHKNSGIDCDLQLAKSWRVVCDLVHRGSPLLKSNLDVEACVASWHQLLRYLAIQLTIAVNDTVHNTLSAKHAKDASLRLRDDIDCLTQTKTLEAELEVPHSAGKLRVKADFMRKTVDVSMRLAAPKDRKLPKSTVFWLVKQLKKCAADDATVLDDVTIRADWPRGVETAAAAKSLLEAVDPLLPVTTTTNKTHPRSFEVLRIVDAGAKFKSATKIVDIVEDSVLRFYQDLGEHLVKWVPKPPKIKTKAEVAGAISPGVPTDQPTDPTSKAQSTTQSTTQSTKGFWGPFFTNKLDDDKLMKNDS